MKVEHLFKRVSLFGRGLLGLGAALALTVSTRADELQLMWQLNPDDVSYMTAGNTERGIAYNPATGHLLLVSRVDFIVHVLDAQTGEDLGQLNMTDVPTTSGVNGTFPISLIDVTDDGVIYVANLTVNSQTVNFRLYRWEDETTEVPALVYEGDPAEGAIASLRFGDSLDVRGTGDNVQIIAGSRASTQAVLITSTNGVDHTAKLIDNVLSGGTLSVAFGPGNTFFSKITSAAARQNSFDPETGAGSLIRNVPISNNSGPISVNVASNWLAAIAFNPAGTPDALQLYDISNPAEPALIDQEPFTADFDNLNNAGDLDMYGDMIWALDTNNGLIAYRVVQSVTAPGIASQPQSLSVLAGGYFTLSPAITGTQPFTYQWRLNGTNLVDQTNATLVLTNITEDAAGAYSVAVTNSAGGLVSDDAIITVLPSVLSDRATVLWKLAPGSRPYVLAENTERGIAYNAKSNHVIVVTRSGNVSAHVLDGDTGADLWEMNTTTDVILPSNSNPGGFRLNMIGAADDGAIYGANLDTGGGGIVIYRWADDAPETVPTVAYQGGDLAGQRYGDTLDVRGSGVDTQILMSSRNGTYVAIFTTFDGENFFPVIVDTPDAPAGNFGLGVSFGEGDTFWGKSTGAGNLLRQVQFDLSSQLGTILQSFELPSAISSIGVYVSSNLLAGVASQETPDNVHLYDISDLTAGPILLDQDFFPTDNPNSNGTGAVDTGNGRIYALDSNNGIIALQLNEGGTVTPDAATFSNFAVSAGTFSATIMGTPNTTYKIEYSTNLSDWTDLKSVTTDANGSVELTDSSTDTFRFYRASAQ